MVLWIEKHAKPDGVVSPELAYGQHELIKQAWDMFHQLPSLNSSLDTAVASKTQLAAQVKAARDIQEKKLLTLPAEKSIWNDDPFWRNGSWIRWRTLRMLLKQHICPCFLLVTNWIQPFYRSWVTWNWWQLGHFLPLQTQQWGVLLMNWSNCFLSLTSTAKQSRPNKLNPLVLSPNQSFRESCLLANMLMDFKVKCPSHPFKNKFLWTLMVRPFFGLEGGNLYRMLHVKIIIDQMRICTCGVDNLELHIVMTLHQIHLPDHRPLNVNRPLLIVSKWFFIRTQVAVTIIIHQIAIWCIQAFHCTCCRVSEAT